MSEGSRGVPRYLTRAQMVARAIERHPHPWRKEPAPEGRWYVVNATGNMVTVCETERDADRLVACSAVFA